MLFGLSNCHNQTLSQCIWSVNWLSSRSFAFSTMTRSKLLGDVHIALDIPLPIRSFGCYPYWLLHNRRRSTSGTICLTRLCDIPSCLWRSRRSTSGTIRTACFVINNIINAIEHLPILSVRFYLRRYFRPGVFAVLCLRTLFCSSAFRVRLLKDWLTVVIRIDWLSSSLNLPGLEYRTRESIDNGRENGTCGSKWECLHAWIQIYLISLYVLKFNHKFRQVIREGSR
jgi:hypothetical protein